MSKKYVSCANKAIIRLPYFSYDFYLTYVKDSKEILNTYDAFFKNNLRLTSKSLYYNISNITNNKNKISIENSVLKYLIRASTRTTPYSMLSMIGVSNFNHEDNSINDNKRIIIRPDYEWLIPIIHMIEKEMGHEMRVTLNNTIDIEDDYIVNNWVDCLYKDNNFNEKRIKVNNTKAVGIIIDKCSNCFVSIQNIIECLQLEYPETDKKIFLNFIYKLLENEILISEFKQAIVGKNFFYEMINRLKKYTDNILLIQLEEIYEYIQKFNEFNQFELIDIIEEKMSKIKKVNNYIRVDCFYDDIINIPLENKYLIEDFVSFILSFSKFNEFDDFIMRFKDKYHNDAIQLKDFLKYNNDLVDIIYNNKYYNQLENSILIKLTNKLIENPNLKSISLEDLFDKNNKKIKLEKGSMEIPFLLLKNKLIYSPMFGSYLKGQSIGRFAYYLNNEFMYNKDEVELCFYPSKSRILNVMDNYALKKRKLCYGTANNNNDLNIDDVYIYCDDNIYFVNSKTGEKIKFGINSKINKAFAPEYIQFIMTVIEKQNGHFFRVINSLANVLTKLKEIPEIYYKDIIVFPKSWIINVEDYKENKNTLTFKDFVKKIKEDISKRNIHNEVFVGNNDQRLLINMSNEKHLKIVYDLLKTSPILKLEKNMFNIDDLIIKDNYGKSYISEVVAQIDYGENIFEKKLNITDYIRQRDIYANMKLFYDNWLSCKIYMDSLNMNDFIHNDMITFLKKLKYEKVITIFYYLRYKDPKEHIRIRIKYTDKNLNILIKEISIFVEKLRNKNLIHDFCIDTYFPEKSRYGGDKLFELSEELFFYNSILVSDLLDFNEINKNMYSIDELFILSSLEILRNLQIDKNELLKIFESFSLLNFPKKNKKLLKEKIIEKVLSQQKKNVLYHDKKEDIDLYIIYSKVENFIRKYGEYLSNYEFEYKKDIVNSLIHMHHNRLVGINRDKENYLMNVLESVIYSISKREIYYEMEK